MTLPYRAAKKQAELAVPLVERISESVSAGIPADRALGRYYREHPEFGSRDRRFFSGLVFSWFRWKGWLLFPSPERCALAYMLDASQAHPAPGIMIGVPAPVPPGAGNLPLEEKAAVVAGLLGVPEPRIESLAPPWLSSILHFPSGATAPGHLRKCLESFQARPSTFIRLSARNSARSADFLKARAPSAVPSGKIALAMEVKPASDLNFTSPGVSFEIQDIASQCVGLLCGPSGGESWWDVCAGGGGKSLHLADLMDQRGSILATDIRKSSLDALARRTGSARRIERRVWNAADDPAPGKNFDGVLLDAPCSGIGTWSRNPDARWRINESDIPLRRALQEKLILSAAEKTKPRGRLIYSVCTLAETETESLVDWFLKARPDFRLESASNPLTGEKTGGKVWIWPWDSGANGMFVARMRREG